MLSVENLGHRFGARWIFRGVGFTVQPGEVLAITGHNGCGKSTLLKIVAGLMDPSEGKIDRPRTGLAALDSLVYPSLTGLQHMQFLDRVHGVTHGAELLDRVGLTAAATRLAGQYSTGMKMRLKLAICLSSSPDLILLDEPTASLDGEGIALVQGVVRAHRESGGMTVIATNDPNDLSMVTHELALS